MGEEDDEDDLGSFAPHSFAPAIKFELLRNQNAFNASVRGVYVDGIHKDVIYGAMPMICTTILCAKSRSKEARGLILCDRRES
jgi:hypothetical protein